jgi:hypothetical protein
LHLNVQASGTFLKEAMGFLDFLLYPLLSSVWEADIMTGDDATKAEL